MKLSAKGRILATVAAAMLASPASADDAFRSVEYRPFVQTTVACPVNLLCAVRLQAGERVRSGLNSEVSAFESNVVYEGSDVQTPLLTFKPATAGQRANVLVTTNRRTYVILLRSVGGDTPTYVRFAFDADRLASRPHPVATPRPLTLVEQFTAACSWMATNAPGEQYAEDAQPARWRPARVCHDDRATWLALPPLATAPSDFPVLHEMAPDGERIANYTIFASERIMRVDGVGDGYVLRAGRKEAMHVRRVSIQAAAPVAVPAQRASRVSLERKPMAVAIRPQGGVVPQPSDTMLARLLEGERDVR